MSYEKKIVTDLDDTLSFTTNRDWANAEPNIKLINKLRQLHNDGYAIHIYTARGQLSCNGNIKLREKKYRTQIEEWLKKYNVPYDYLSFEKPLATYYIDDKAVTPEDFVDYDFEVLQGRSGALIIRNADKVHKTHENSLLTAKWYEIVRPYVNVPKVYKVVGSTISLEYIKHVKIANIHEIFTEIFRLTDITVHDVPDFDTYTDRIQKHLQDNNMPEHYLKIITQYEKYYNANKTFCHGDSAIDNFIHDGENLYMIDPIFLPSMYSSYLLDVSKIMQSLIRFGKKNEYDRLKMYHTPQILALELSWWIRFYKYANDDEKKLTLENIARLICLIPYKD